jgi:NCAIR mutase (PurE)-related protein
VTCYFRHLNEVFKKAGIEVTNKNKREIDRVIHEIVGVEYKSCPATWRKVKERLAEDEAAFVSRLSKDVKKALESKRMETAS